MHSLLTLFHSLSEFITNCLSDILDGPKGFVEDIISVLGKGLQAQVHFGFGWMGDTISNELDIGVA